ncbi:unnamed protein product [Cyclocybe aegerita]|uniref:Adipose-regulatory protein n=1 Tax=Cyclocybe aegerita TaxID=1973307 RepID=A0A8S0XLT5_CYCAE|nr:unnamed protein product [Cyclocybe aegerita]
MSERVATRRTKSAAADDEPPSLLLKIASVPLNLLLAVLSSGFSALRPFAPRLIPLLVCSFFIPLVVFLSVSAGWYVWKSLSVSWEAPLYLQYGDGISPYAFAQLPRLATQQKYDISADLVLPYIESNTMLGNFMTSLTLSTTTNKTLAYVRRAAIALPARSSFIFPKPITARVTVPLLHSFISSTPNVVAHIEIGRRDGWTTLGNGQGREVSIAQASLRGLAVPHGIRGIAIRFPLLSSLAAAGIFLFILSLVLGSCILPLVLPSIADEENDELDEKETKPKVESRDSNGVSASQGEREGRRRRRSRSNKGQGERTIKTEPSVQAMPSAAESSSRGLRRRSSKPAILADDEDASSSS